MLSVLERHTGPAVSVLMDRMRAACLRARGARLGEKVRVGPRCTVQRPWGLTAGVRCQLEHDVFIKITEDAAQVFLGEEVFLGRGVELDVSLRLTIGNHVLIAPGCFITDHAHRHAIGTTIASQGCVSGAVTIGDDVWLGVNAVVLAGVSIGAGAIVGAGSVVTRDVAPMTIVAGAPARPVSRRTVT